MTSGINAQLVLERELVGAVATVSTSIASGNTQQLQVDASFGESMIGYQEGDIVITIGFHQPGTLANEGNIGNLIEEDEPIVNESEAIQVNAYPNPTISSLTVDLGSFREKFNELRLIDIYGRTVKTRRVDGVQQTTFSSLEALPNANYFLQGIGKDGKLHQLSTIMIIKD